MTDPRNPVQTIRLVTPAMDQPRESLVTSGCSDISADCTVPELTTVFTTIPDLLLPQPLYLSDAGGHGLNLSDDGTRTYFANSGEGVIILDTTDIANRVADPQVTGISRLDWTSRSIPQNAIPFTNRGKMYLLEIDEFGACSEVGSARTIDINDETAPFVLSNVRLEVHDPANFDAVCSDPGTSTPVLQGLRRPLLPHPHRGRAGQRRLLDDRIGSSHLRITDPARPVEVAYFNAPVQPRPIFDTPLTGSVFEASYWAMSAPAFEPERKEVWYTDAFQGFFAVRVTNDMWPDTLDDGIHAVVEDSDPDLGAAPDPSDPVPAVTGAAAWLQAAGAMLILGALALRGRRRRELA